MQLIPRRLGGRGYRESPESQRPAQFALFPAPTSECQPHFPKYQEGQWELGLGQTLQKESGIRRLQSLELQCRHCRSQPIGRLRKLPATGGQESGDTTRERGCRLRTGYCYRARRASASSNSWLRGFHIFLMSEEILIGCIWEVGKGAAKSGQ